MDTHSRRSVLGWALYDFAESAFATSILVAILPVYYLTIAPKGDFVISLGPFHVTTAASSVWAYTISFSTMLIAFPSPVLGALADVGGRRKLFLAVFGYTGALFSGLLVFVGTGDYFLASALFCVANIGSVGSTVYYNALLVDVAPPGKMDMVSGKGFAWGYLGGGTVFVINLLMIANPGWFGIPSQEWGIRISFLVVGVWWAVFTIPTMLWVRERPRAEEKPLGGVVKAAFRNTWSTLRRLTHYRDLARYLLAFLVFNDGIQTVIVMAVPYGKETLGLDTTTLMGTLVLIQAIGIPGSLMFGWIAEKLGAKQGLLISLAIWCCVVFLAWRMTSAAEFWVLGALVGLVLGGSQAISRSLYGSMVPASQAAEFYGFLAVSSRFSSFFGPLVFGLARDITGSMRAGILALIVFFVVGSALLMLVNVQRGMDKAKEEDGRTAE
jgi:UMF1 family MFS transporter